MMWKWQRIDDALNVKNKKYTQTQTVECSLSNRFSFTFKLTKSNERFLPLISLLLSIRLRAQSKWNPLKQQVVQMPSSKWLENGTGIYLKSNFSCANGYEQSV